MLSKMNPHRPDLYLKVCETFRGAIDLILELSVFGISFLALPEISFKSVCVPLYNGRVRD